MALGFVKESTFSNEIEYYRYEYLHVIKARDAHLAALVSDSLFFSSISTIAAKLANVAPYNPKNLI